VIIGILLVSDYQVRRERNLALLQQKRAEASELVTSQNLYAADIAEAESALAAGDYELALRSLVPHKPVSSNSEPAFEWRWLWQRVQGDSIKTAGGHVIGVNALAYSPDGRTMLSGGGGGEVRLWEADSLRLIRSMVQIGSSPSPPDIEPSWDSKVSPSVFSLSFSSDGRLFSCGSARGIDIGDPVSGEWLRRFPRGDKAYFASTSPGRIIAALGTPPTELAWFDPGESKPITNWPAASYGLALSPNGRYLASFERPMLIVQDLEAGKAIANFRPAGYIMDLAFSPDSKTLGLCLMNEGAVELWNVEPWQQRGRLARHPGRIQCLAFSPDGKLVASGGHDQTVRIWDIAEHKELRQLRGHRAAIRAVAFSPDGKRLASGSIDCKIRLWDVNPPPAPPPITNVFGAFAFSKNGRKVLTQNKAGDLKLYDLTSRLPLKEWKEHPFEDAAFIAGERIIVISKSISNSAPCLTLLEGDSSSRQCSTPLSAIASPCSAAAISPDGTICVTGHDDGTVAFWNAADGSLRSSSRPHTNQVYRFSFSYNSKHLACVYWDQTWYTMWDAREGKMLSERRFTLRFSTACAVAPDGTRFAMGGAAVGSSIRLFNTTDSSPAAKLSGHLDDVRRLAYAPSGLTLASTGIDHTLKLWHLATGRPLLTLPQGEMLDYLAFSPDGTWLGLATGQGELRLWHAPRLAELSDPDGML